MLIVSDFMKAWGVVDARRGRMTIDSLTAFLESVVRVEIPDYYQEGVWVTDGHQDARLDLEALWPMELLPSLAGQGLEDLDLALGKDDLDAARRFVGDALAEGSGAPAASPALSVIIDHLWASEMASS